MGRNTAVPLTTYSHDRDADFKKSSDELRDLIDKFAEQEQLSSLYDYFQKRYSLPEGVVKQKIKKRIATSYRYKMAEFEKDLSLKWILASFIKHLGFLFCALIYSRRFKRASNYKLIVDGIVGELEFKRFKKLIDLFKKKDVLIISTNEKLKAAFPEYNIKFTPRLKRYDIYKVIKAIWNEIFFGIWGYIRLSLVLRVNLFTLISPVINDYLQYSTLFKENRAEHIIQERHYATSAVKNYLFKKYGGRAAASIQKNLIQLDSVFYYCDIDYLFSLGNRTAGRFFEYGARIGRVIPVGSMFMEYWWFSNSSDIKKKFDIIFLGMNIMNAYERMDSYSKFMDDYYDCIRWLVRFRKEYPAYSIAIKHHASGGDDKIEKEITAGSGIETVPKQGNSYEIAFASRCAVTYGSTMGYELHAHGLPTIFLDPNYRCTNLPDRDDNLLDGLRVASYEAFRDLALSFLKGNAGKETLSKKVKADDLCLSSENVSERIYQNLINTGGGINE